MPAHGKRRALGQHFLRDTAISGLIAQTALSEAEKYRSKTLLEIGPGKGAITHPLLNAFDVDTRGIEHFVLCERDEALAALWRDIAKIRAGGPFRFTVEEGDFLKLPENRWSARPPVAVVSNLPYSAGTAIFTLLASFSERIPVMVLMFQAEVAHRLRAEVGTKDWGRLSVWTQNEWDVTKLVSVSKKAFNPPPDVESEVVIVTRRDQPRIPAAIGNPHWEPLLKTCFTHRRKMLRSGLPSQGPYREALERSGVNPTKRPEALTWDDWARLVEALT